MGRIKISHDNEISRELEFDEEQSISHSYYRIRSEYLRKILKKVVYLIPIIIILVVHFTVIYPLYLDSDIDPGISTLQPSRFRLTINWALFSTGTYLIFYLIKFVIIKTTQSLKKYIKDEINNLGYEIDEKNRSVFSFIILNLIAVAILLLIELRINNFYNLMLNAFFKGMLICFLSLAIFVPILWHLFFDRLRIKLKHNYQIYITPYYKVRKIKSKDYQLIYIYFTSNRLAYRFSRDKRELYNKITETRWLPRKKKYIFSKHYISPFLRFIEFSTPSNIQKPFLNIALALQEWDSQYKEKFSRTCI